MAGPDPARVSNPFTLEIAFGPFNEPEFPLWRLYLGLRGATSFNNATIPEPAEISEFGPWARAPGAVLSDDGSFSLMSASRGRPQPSGLRLEVKITTEDSAAAAAKP